MIKKCQQCGAGFEFSGEELKFIERVSPVINGKKYLFVEPDLCPDDRERLRQL
ncbi:hypothetical protein HZA40_00075 [Candidatus Peregrinibacteria bacterium]|nr:hypothetical protein [Candidatus Peregrinibacteria bacterium]